LCAQRSSAHEVRTDAARSGQPGHEKSAEISNRRQRRRGRRASQAADDPVTAPSGRRPRTLFLLPATAKQFCRMLKPLALSPALRSSAQSVTCQGVDQTSTFTQPRIRTLDDVLRDRDPTRDRLTVDSGNACFYVHQVKHRQSEEMLHDLTSASQMHPACSATGESFVIVKSCVNVAIANWQPYSHSIVAGGLPEMS
jgi:hypothetical protein